MSTQISVAIDAICDAIENRKIANKPRDMGLGYALNLLATITEQGEEIAAMKRKMELHAGDICSANNEAELHIAKNQDLEKLIAEQAEEIKDLEARGLLSESQNYCKLCGNILDGYVPQPQNKTSTEP